MERRSFFKKIGIATGALMFAPLAIISTEEISWINQCENEFLMEFVEQLRYYNKLITITDQVIYHSAKEITLTPEVISSPL